MPISSRSESGPGTERPIAETSKYDPHITNSCNNISPDVKTMNTVKSVQAAHMIISLSLATRRVTRIERKMTI